MQFPHETFKNAGMNPSDVGHLIGVSRVTGYRWLLGTNRNGTTGVGVNIFLQDKVAKVAAQVEAAVAAGALPDDNIKKLPPEKRAGKLRSILNKYRTKK
jgi:hypothetical protein